MALPTHAVPSHLLFAFTTLAAAALAAGPWNDVAVMVVLVGSLAGLMVRLVPAWMEGEGRLSRFAPLVAMGVLLLPSFLQVISVPLSLRGPEGAGSVFGGLSSLEVLVSYALVLAFLSFPFFMVASVLELHDRTRQVVLLVGAVSWSIVAAITVFFSSFASDAMWLGMRETVLLSLRITLLGLAFGFLYGLKADPRIGSSERMRDGSAH